MRVANVRDEGQSCHGPDSTLNAQLSVVIVSYNCLGQLQQCLESVPNGAGSLQYEVIVVDNNSADGTSEWLRSALPQVRVISNKTNRGFARACNQGICEAHGRYVLLLNPDTIANDGALSSTYDFLENTPNLAAAGCKVLRPDGSLDPSCKRDFPSPWDAFCRMVGLSKLFPRKQLFARYDACDIDQNKRQEVPLIDGCYMMIRRSALDDIGLFDERFFMYAEEMDWCKRAHMRGWAIGYDPSGTIVHVKGEITRHRPFRMLYHFHLSMALYYGKYHHPWGAMSLIVYPGILLRFALLTLWNVFRAERRVSG